MKLLITGACGHIGSALIRRRKSMKRFDEIILLDDMSSERYCSLFNVMPRLNYRFVQGSICDPELVHELVGKVDVVVHLAAKTNATETVNHPAITWFTNVYGTRIVATACHDKCRLLFPSTTSVYGQSSGVVGEKAVFHPQSPYAESKLKAESEVLQGTLYRTVFRFGTIAGVSQGMRFHTAVNKFIWQAITHQPLTVWRTAMNQLRPYLSLSDCIRAIEFFLEDPDRCGGVYNVVTENRSLSSIIEVIKQHVGMVHVDLVDSPIMNQLSYTVSAERFENLGFEFTGSIDSDIEETIRWLRRIS